MIDRLLLTSLLALGAEAHAVPGPVEHIAALLTPVERFQAEFSQTVFGERGEVKERAEGFVRIARPKKFKWVIEDPYPQLIVTEGDRLYVYDPDLEQVQIRRVDQALDGTPALVLTGDAAQIDANFAVSESIQDGLVTFTLVPKSARALYTEMRMVFDAEELAAIDIRDSLGQSTEVRFYNSDASPEFPGNEFEFSVPPSADVIGDVPSDPT